LGTTKFCGLAETLFWIYCWLFDGLPLFEHVLHTVSKLPSTKTLWP
jgi:hypothetical protein